MGYTLVPLGGFALLALPGLVAALYKLCVPAFGKGERYHNVQNAVAFWSLFFLYTIYPAVSVAVVAPWNCHSVNLAPQTPNPNLQIPNPKPETSNHKP